MSLKVMVIKFESPAEAVLYPILNSLALKNKLLFYYQYAFEETAYWVDNLNIEGQEGFERLEEWANEKEIDMYHEVYRADFVLKSPPTKPTYRLIIEVDGESYHRDIQYEAKRDSYFCRHGFDVLHVTAKDVLYHQGKIKDLVLSKFKEKGVINAA